jgi:hypothetical protein
MARPIAVRPFGIGPVCDGLRCGWRVRVTDRSSRFFGREGYIKLVGSDGRFYFVVDFGRGRPSVGSLRSEQLEVL